LGIVAQKEGMAVVIQLLAALCVGWVAASMDLLWRLMFLLFFGRPCAALRSAPSGKWVSRKGPPPQLSAPRSTRDLV
jgi:hypothetical protein